jgi:transposase
LFYYFRLEGQVPETHLLRLIDKHISAAFVRERLKQSYSEMGRLSIDPELLLRILLIGYQYGITSERKLVEGLRMHLAWRWFTGLGFGQEIPHHSTFSKNRHGRLPGRFIHVDGKIPECSTGALRFLRACSTTFTGPDIGIGAVPLVTTFVLQRKAEYICADHPVTFIFPLRQSGGPYIPACR